MKKASSSLETVVGILIIVMALFAMSAYVKGGIAGKWKSATEGALGPQYDPEETSFVNEYVKAGSSESVTRMEKRSKIINVTVGDKEYKHKADVWYQVSYQNAGSQGLVDDQGNEVFAQDLDRHSMKEITTKTYNVDVGDTLMLAANGSSGSATNTSGGADTSIPDEDLDDQTTSGNTATEESDTGGVVTEVHGSCWYSSSTGSDKIDCDPSHERCDGRQGGNIDFFWKWGPEWVEASSCSMTLPRSAKLTKCLGGTTFDSPEVNCPSTFVIGD